MALLAGLSEGFGMAWVIVEIGLYSAKSIVSVVVITELHR
jgi:hypothetical protein